MSEDQPRLYLATPPLAQARDFLPALTSALAAGDIASLLVRFAGDDPRENEAILRALAPVAQEKGVAVLAEDSVNVALRGGADGAHINGAGEELADAVKKLSPKYIVGAGDLPTRDDAMRAGELNADYVLFDDDDLATLTERVGWWAQLFNTPCVARASSLDRVSPLAQAGADFILLDDAVWRDQRSPAAAVADALKSLQPGDREYD
jgi:thiamine-phosphate pyrophosphorylase